MKCLIIFTVFFAMVFTACDLDKLYNSGEEEQRESPRDRREPNDDDDPEPPPAVSPRLFLPLTAGNTWTYDVVYTQEARDPAEYRAVYKGEETWELTTARFSDSTFVFRTWFTGLKIIGDTQSSQTLPVSGTYAYVTAQIRKGALVVVQETGDELCPFLGDWLFLMQTHFKVCFHSSDVVVQHNKMFSHLEFSYTLDKNRGLLTGRLDTTSEYDVISLSYQLK